MEAYNDPTSLIGMSALINTSQTATNFDPQELENEIANNNQQNIDFTEKFELDLNSISLEETTNIDKLLSDADLLDTEKEPPPQFKDPQLSYITEEQKNKTLLNNVFKNIGGETQFDIERATLDDEKARKLDSIEGLKEILIDSGEDVSRVRHVDKDSGLQEIDEVLTYLNIKNDRKRCSMLAEESLILGAHAIEWLFDGKKSYFGFVPDASGWHKTIPTKLRRMRYETSTIVSNVMRDYNLGSGTRVALELLPSLMLHVKMNRNHHGDNLATINDDAFKASINKIRDYE